jgi:hypothetical protein
MQIVHPRLIVPFQLSDVGVAFMLGLNYTYINERPLSEFTLDPSSFKDFGLFLWGILIFVVLLVSSILYFVFVDYKRIGILKWYLLLGVAWVLGVNLQSRRMKKQNRQLHLHHYCLAFIILSFICYQSVFISIIHEFCQGMMIEGGARWGFNEIWTPKDDPEITEA